MPGFLVKDKQLSVTKALPNGAATAASNGIDLGLSEKADNHMPLEILIEAPALDATAMPNGKTMVYAVFHAADEAFATETAVYGNVLTQAGAGGVGCAAASKRVALPSDVKRYIRVKATGSAAGDASGSSFAASLVF